MSEFSGELLGMGVATVRNFAGCRSLGGAGRGSPGVYVVKAFYDHMKLVGVFWSVYVKIIRHMARHAQTWTDNSPFIYPDEKF